MLTIAMPRNTQPKKSPGTLEAKSVAGGVFDVRRAIGGRIATLRQQRQWTLKEMAAKLSVPFSVYTKWEYGVHVPPVEKLIQLVEILQTTLDYLLTGNQTEGRPLHNTRLLERFQALQDLPSDDIETAINVIDGLVVRREVEATVSRRSPSRKVSAMAAEPAVR